MKKKQKKNYNHLILEERFIIQKGIENGAKKCDIAKTLGKDASTIAKEIRSHFIVKPKRTFSLYCDNRNYNACPRKDRSPGAFIIAFTILYVILLEKL